MENTLVGNGGLPQQPQLYRNGLSIDKTKKGLEIPALECRNWLLHRHYTRHEYKLTKQLIDQELASCNGHNEYASYLKGLILRREGRVQESLDCFQNSYNANTTNTNNVKQIAKSLMLLGSHKRAIDAYSEAARMPSTPDWEIHHSLGECYIQLNLLEEARTELEKAIELTKNEIPFLSLARLYVTQNKIDEAIEVYSKAIKCCSESEDASIELGLLYLKIGELQKAFQEFGTVLAQQPGSTKAIFPIAYIIQNHHEYDVALSKYKIAAQNLPESPHLWNNIGMCFYGKQKFVAAISCLKRAHYLNPMALLPAYNLGRVLLSTGQPASAAIYLCAAVSAAPKNPLPYMLLGLALKKLEDPDGAERALAKAHSLSPQNPLVLVNYAAILHERRKSERAAEILSNLGDISAVMDVEQQILDVARKILKKINESSTENEK